LFLFTPLAVIIILGSSVYYLSAFCFLAPFFRNIPKEKIYWKSAGNNPGVILKTLFLWSILWLAYIMFEFYSTSPMGTHTLSVTEWALFGIPIAFVYIFYEIQLYKQCDNYYNA